MRLRQFANMQKFVTRVNSMMPAESLFGIDQGKLRFNNSDIGNYFSVSIKPDEVIAERSEAQTDAIAGGEAQQSEAPLAIRARA